MLIGTIFIFSGIELKPNQVAPMQSAHVYSAYLRSEAPRFVTPYLLPGCQALPWAFVILRTKFPQMLGEADNVPEDHGRLSNLLKYPHFMFAVLAQFIYVGTQVATWSYFIQYVQEYG